MAGNVEKSRHVNIRSANHCLYNGHKLSQSKSRNTSGERLFDKLSGCTQK